VRLVISFREQKPLFDNGNLMLFSPYPDHQASTMLSPDPSPSVSSISQIDTAYKPSQIGSAGNNKFQPRCTNATMTACHRDANTRRFRSRNARDVADDFHSGRPLL
jgi:hypothetical protein